MRYAGFLAAALIIVSSCGPDPNAKLPQFASPSKGGSGGAGSGGESGSGGSSGSGGKSTHPEGTGGGSGGESRTGGKQGTGGKGGGGESGTGGRTGRGTGGSTTGDGGADGTGGRFGNQGGRAGTGGRFGGQGGGDGSGGRIGPPIDGGGGDEPCTPDKTITGTGSANTGNIGTGALCFKTPDNISGWGCSNFTGRTLKVNSVVVECAKLPLPAKVNGYYYFDISAGGVEYASIYWY